MGAVADPKTGKKSAVPAATEVVPGFYIGGKYSDERRKRGVVVIVEVSEEEEVVEVIVRS